MTGRHCAIAGAALQSRAERACGIGRRDSVSRKTTAIRRPRRRAISVTSAIWATEPLTAIRAVRVFGVVRPAHRPKAGERRDQRELERKQSVGKNANEDDDPDPSVEEILVIGATFAPILSGTNATAEWCKYY
jgi:hypothetical protein